ncbi:hypothetical protein [Aquimarina aquimarini]|uniref:hypothetical protein n=1 Tax=Aquimarina aquimarini TaxID=1191734 RepID=UPI000D55597E|nr:hypothetical protein [Aquimarina aquimarini]
MKKKWYFGTLITALALLVAIQQQALVPNQEIVLEFVDIEVTSLEAQNTIEIVKKQLQSIGVERTRISKGLANGKLTIAYYSDADVEDIKKILSEEQNVALDHIFYGEDNEDSQFPLDKNSKDYNFDVYEIQKSTDFNSDFNSKYVLEVKQEQGGYFSLNSCSCIAVIDVNYIDKLVKVAQKVNRNIAIAIDTTSPIIPEVRAGPIS